MKKSIQRWNIKFKEEKHLHNLYTSASKNNQQRCQVHLVNYVSDYRNSMLHIPKKVKTNLFSKGFILRRMLLKLDWYKEEKARVWGNLYNHQDCICNFTDINLVLHHICQEKRGFSKSYSYLTKIYFSHCAIRESSFCKVAMLIFNIYDFGWLSAFFIIPFSPIKAGKSLFIWNMCWCWY